MIVLVLPDNWYHTVEEEQQRMLESLREMWERRWLLYTLVRRDLQVKYHGSYLGFALTILVPIAQVAVLTFVIKFIFRPGDPDYRNYSALLFAGLLPWSFTQSCVTESCEVVAKHRQIVRKIYFPREVLPLSTVLSNLIHLGFTLLMFIGFLVVMGHGLRWSYLGVLVLLGVQTAFSLGLALFVAAANTFYRDLESLLAYVFTLGFYASPILYQSERVAQSHTMGKLYEIYMLNPMACMIEYYRHFFLGFPPPEGRYLVWTLTISFFSLYGGYKVYRRAQWRFPEMV